MDAADDKVGDSFEIRLYKAAGGERWGPEAEPARDHGALISRHGVLVARDVRELEDALDA